MFCDDSLRCRSRPIIGQNNEIIPVTNTINRIDLNDGLQVGPQSDVMPNPRCDVHAAVAPMQNGARYYRMGKHMAEAARMREMLRVRITWREIRTLRKKDAADKSVLLHSIRQQFYLVTPTSFFI